MHRRSQALPAEGISKPLELELESPVTYTENRNDFIKLCCNHNPVNGCRSLIDYVFELLFGRNTVIYSAYLFDIVFH